MTVLRSDLRVLAGRAFLAHSLGWGVASLVAYGLVAAIIPNPVFGRQIPPEPFAIGTWILSAPLIGLVLATYTAAGGAPGSAPVALAAPDTSAAPTTTAAPDTHAAPDAEAERGSVLASIGGLGAFLAIGCPVCNKVALILLGTSGALSVWAPLQPVLGAASLALLAGTLVWRLRLRVRGAACAVPPR